jgi:hypothetical protein
LADVQDVNKQGTGWIARQRRPDQHKRFRSSTRSESPVSKSTKRALVLIRTTLAGDPSSTLRRESDVLVGQVAVDNTVNIIQVR